MFASKDTAVPLAARSDLKRDTAKESRKKRQAVRGEDGRDIPLGLVGILLGLLGHSFGRSSLGGRHGLSVFSRDFGHADLVLLLHGQQCVRIEKSRDGPFMFVFGYRTKSRRTRWER